MPHFADRKSARDSKKSTKRPTAVETEDPDSTNDDRENDDEESNIDEEHNSDVESDSSSDGPEEGDTNGEAQKLLSQVSFGALAKAQNALSQGGDRKRKRGQETNSEHESKLDTIRERLRELREQKEAKAGTAIASKGEKKAKRQTQTLDNAPRDQGGFFDNEEDSSDSETGSASDSDGSDNKSGKRSSKHAPTAMPANRAVGRYRDVVQAAKIKSRDPRFDSTSGHLDRNAISSRYSFLSGYQADELTSLKKALKNTRAKYTEEEREKLQRKIVSMESRIAADKAREREEKIKREHKKQERDAVKQGKQPFYLKKSEVRQQALVDRFEGMKSRQKDKVIQRRRKKLAGKEWRDMPTTRRV